MWKQTLLRDDYQGSLETELARCRKTIGHIKKSLELLEQKYRKTTKVFIEEFNNGQTTGPDNEDDYSAWLSSYQSLQQWESLQAQYREEYQKIKR